MNRSGSRDDQLLRRLLAPPELHDGLESLDYWNRRGQGLPWYRIRARREALRMTMRWEQRVREAVVSQHRVPLEDRVFAGALVVRSRLARWMRRAGLAALAAVTTAVVLVMVPTVAALIVLLNAL